MYLFKAIAIVAPSLYTFTTAQSLKSILASSSSTLSIFHGLLEQFDLLDRFSSFSNITIIAPTNQAYLDLAQWGFNLSLVEPSIAQALLTYHVLDGEWTSKSIPSGNPQVVHTYLQPPILTNVSSGAAVKLHRKGNDIISESGLQVLGGVEEADIQFENGVLHTLNSSMVLPHNISVTAQLNGLTEFLEILGRAYLVDTVESLEDITVFVPHNAVLKRLGPLLHMLNPRQLADILGYHVVPGKVLYAEILSKGDATFTTLNGATLNTRVDGDGTIFINNGKVVRSDLIIYGGVAHVIDDVLVPSSSVASDSVGSSQQRITSSSPYQVPL